MPQMSPLSWFILSLYFNCIVMAFMVQVNWFPVWDLIMPSAVSGKAKWVW